MSVIRFAIIDDHLIFRQGLRYALAGDSRLQCIGEAANGHELIALLEAQPCDIALLDLKMPEMDGIEVLKLIRKKNKQLKVLALTMFEDEHFVLEMMEAGANGYLLKNTDPEEIKTAIYTVVDSGYYFNDHVSIALLKKLKDNEILSASDAVRLTDKEILVLQMICEELTAAEIADRIFLSTRRVEGIRSSLMEKTGSRNIVGLALYAVRNGIVQG